jgi:hypothetical protein
MRWYVSKRRRGQRNAYHNISTLDGRVDGLILAAQNRVTISACSILEFLMLVRQFKFKRNNDKGGFQWTAESEIERPGFHRRFYAVGNTLADVQEFAALVRLCERTGLLERLSEMHPLGWEKRMQTTWGGNWHTTWRTPTMSRGTATSRCW